MPFSLFKTRARSSISMYRRTSNTNGATANYWVPGAEFGAPVSSASQVCFCFKSLDSNGVCSQGFTFDIPLSRYCTLTTCLLRCSQAQQYNVARGFARPVGTPGANSPLVSGHECCKFVFTNSTSPLTQGRVPRRGHSAFFPASPVPNFAPARSFRGGGQWKWLWFTSPRPGFPLHQFWLYFSDVGELDSKGILCATCVGKPNIGHRSEPFRHVKQRGSEARPNAPS